GQTIVKTQFGGAEIKRHASGPRSGRPLSIADDYKAAASDALKKCASLLGIGLDLYGRDRPYEADEPAALAKKAESRKQKAVREPEDDVLSAGRPEAVAVGVEVGKLDGSHAQLCTAAQWREISKLTVQAGMSVAELCASLSVQTLSQLTEARAERVIKRLGQLADARQAVKAS